MPLHHPSIARAGAVALLRLFARAAVIGFRRFTPPSPVLSVRTGILAQVPGRARDSFGI